MNIFDRWDEYLRGLTPEQIVDALEETESPDKLPPGLANPTVSKTWDVDKLRTDAIKRALNGGK